MSAAVLNVMTPKEREIMDLWDSGLSAEMIIEELDRAEYLVRRTIATYHDSGDEAAAQRAMAAGSARLLAALRAA